MTRDMIETFLYVYSCKNISAAAKELYITQSAVSYRLSQLEREVGYTLFVRKKGIRNVVLTNQGAKFLPIAQQFLSFWGDVQCQIKEDRKFISISVACPSFISNNTFFGFFQNYLGTHKQIQLYLLSKHSHEMYELLEKREIDIGYGAQQIFSPDIESVPVFSWDMVLVSSTKGRFHDGFNPMNLDPEEEIFIDWNHNPRYKEWHDRYWPGKVYYAATNSISVIRILFASPNKWAIIPRNLYIVLQKEYDFDCYSLIDPAPGFTFYQHTLRYPEANKAYSIKEFCSSLQIYLQENQ